ncbi:MAG: hypothetical protein OEX09_03105 [Candidatus Bathyarchaeota archaeon]|nr:hypothetical protein [Candidatus Bathyarchaeota archaeon]
MGSQPRRSRDRRGRRRAGSGGTGGAPEGDDEKRQAEEAKQRQRIYRKARETLVGALTTKDFSYAAKIATCVTTSRASVPDVVSLFVAGAKAYSEGKDRAWKPDPTKLANSGIRYAREKTGYELSLERQQSFNSILAANLRKVGEKSRRK